MTESEFYGHVFLSLPVLGFLFWCMMGDLAKKNCIENPLGKHIALKVLGGLSIAIGVVMFVAGFVLMTKLEFPEQSLPQPITSNSYIRPSGTYLQIGYPTKLQDIVISEFIGTIQFVGLGLYLWCFRKSGTKWWQKTLKVVAYTTMFLLLPSAMDFHYYDLYEFISPALLIVLATLCLINWNGLKNDKNGNKNKELAIGETKSGKPNEHELSSMDVEL